MLHYILKHVRKIAEIVALVFIWGWCALGASFYLAALYNFVIELMRN